MKTTEHPTEAQPEEPLNDLSDVLTQVAPYWRTIAGVAVVGITALGLFGFISSNRRSAEESSWAAYFDAVGNSDPTALQIVAQNSSGSVVPWAQQATAQAKLIEASQNLYTDRELARIGFEEAITQFKLAIARSDSLGLLNQRSRWGLGQAHEGMNQLDQAKSTYQQLVDRWPESSLAKRAQDRITSLNSPETQDFYKWFFAQQPVTPPAFDAGPSQPFSVPTEPDVTVPDISTLIEPTDEPTDEPVSDDADADANSIAEPDSTATTTIEPTTEQPVERPTGDVEPELTDAPAKDDAATETTDGPAETTELIESAEEDPADVIEAP